MQKLKFVKVDWLVVVEWQLRHNKAISSLKKLKYVTELYFI